MPVKSSSPTNQKAFRRPNALHGTQPTVSENLEGNNRKISLFILMAIFQVNRCLLKYSRGATTAEKLRGPRFGSEHRGACAQCLATGRAGVGVGGGRPRPLWGSGGVTPRNFFLKTQMLNPAFWWLLRSLVGSRGHVYPSKQQACQGPNQFQKFNFSAVVAPLVVRTKNQSNGNYEHVNCMQHVILVHNKQRL